MPGFDACSRYTSCDSCASFTACGWCNTNSLCSAGSSTGPAVGECANWKWSSMYCSSTQSTPLTYALPLCILGVIAIIIIGVILFRTGNCTCRSCNKKVQPTIVESIQTRPSPQTTRMLQPIHPYFSRNPSVPPISISHSSPRDMNIAILQHLSAQRFSMQQQQQHQLQQQQPPSGADGEQSLSSTPARHSSPMRQDSTIGFAPTTEYPYSYQDFPGAVVSDGPAAMTNLHGYAVPDLASLNDVPYGQPLTFDGGMDLRRGYERAGMSRIPAVSMSVGGADYSNRPYTARPASESGEVKDVYPSQEYMRELAPPSPLPALQLPPRSSTSIPSNSEFSSS